MSRFMMFGFLPVVFNEAMWEVDTGSVALNTVAGALARLALKAVATAERTLDVVIPIKLVPVDETGPSKFAPA